MLYAAIASRKGGCVKQKSGGVSRQGSRRRKEADVEHRGETRLVTRLHGVSSGQASAATASWHNDPEFLATDGKPGRKRTDVLALNVERNRGVALELDGSGPKMFHPARAVELVREQPPAAAEKAAPINLWKNGNCQQAIPQVRSWKQRKASAVEPPVADQNQLAAEGFLPVAGNDLWFRTSHRLGPRDDVSESADFLFVLPIHELDGARIDASAGHLGERAVLGLAGEAKLGLGQVDERLACLTQNRPCRGKIGGEAKLPCEHVDRAQGHDTETSASEAIGLVANAVEDLVDGSIATRGYDEFEAFADGFGSEGAARAGRVRGFQRALRGERVQMFPEWFAFSP